MQSLPDALPSFRCFIAAATDVQMCSILQSLPDALPSFRWFVTAATDVQMCSILFTNMVVPTSDAA